MRCGRHSALLSRFQQCLEEHHVVTSGSVLDSFTTQEQGTVHQAAVDGRRVADGVVQKFRQELEEEVHQERVLVRLFDSSYVKRTASQIFDNDDRGRQATLCRELRHAYLFVLRASSLNSIRLTFSRKNGLGRQRGSRGSTRHGKKERKKNKRVSLGGLIRSCCASVSSQLTYHRLDSHSMRACATVSACHGEGDMLLSNSPECLERAQLAIIASSKVRLQTSELRGPDVEIF